MNMYYKKSKNTVLKKIKITHRPINKVMIIIFVLLLNVTSAVALVKTCSQKAIELYDYLIHSEVDKETAFEVALEELRMCEGQ